MPYRKPPLVTHEIYHVFNRSIAKQPIFLNTRDYQRVLETINFYRYQKPPVRLSHFKRLSTSQKDKLLKDLSKTGELGVEILAYCIMPNHFHLLVKQLNENSLSRFVSNFQNSYSKYFNIKTDRSGSVFQSMFKAVRIETDEQLLHVSRYIHLNPVSSSVIRVADLKNYQWSSFRKYIDIDSNSELVKTKLILNHFKSRSEYEKFVLDQADYQKELEKIKHLILE